MHIIISDLKKYIPKDNEIITLHSYIKNRLNNDDQKRVRIDGIKAFKNPYETAKAYKFISKIINEISPILGNKLNTIHNKNYEMEYWRVMLSTWLLNYISMLYDRYSRLKNALLLEKNLTISASEKNFSEFEFINGIQFFETASLDKEFNQYIYTLIAEKIGIKVIDKNRNENNKSILVNDNNTDINFVDNQKRNLFTNFFKQVVKKFFLLIKKLEEKIFSRKAHIIFYHSYLPKKFSFIISLLSFYKIYELNPRRIDGDNQGSNKKNEQIRSIFLRSIDKENHENDFINIIYEMVDLCIPKSFIEDYENIIKYSNNVYKNLTPKVIFSPNSWYYDYSFIHWAMLCKIKGTKIISGTHSNGGPPCLDRYKILTDFEKSFADYYIDVGKYYLNHRSIKNVTSSILLNSRNKKRRIKDQILYVGTDDPLYPVGSLEDFNYYIENTILFLTSISKNIQKKIFYRGHYEDIGWSVSEVLSHNFPNLKFSLWNKKLHEEIFRSKLCIFGYISTTCHESLALNVPTLIFFDKEQYLLTKETIVDFKKLQEVGIMHDNITSLVEWIELNYSEIDKWWYSNKCQEVVRDFNYKYMHIGKNPYKEWKDLFLSLSKNN